MARQPVARAAPDVTALASLQVDSAISYAIAVIIPALDAILPVLPSETVVIALGVATAGSADPRIALLVACSSNRPAARIVNHAIASPLRGRAPVMSC